jgi:prolyl-tRNA editing enzyme YbaK/EbsC (Cys-tRNA(Pro) deacylase)
MYEKIKTWLDSKDIKYKTVNHEPTLTSEQSALARGEDLAKGGKALVMKVGGEFKLFVLSASRKLDSSAIKKHFGIKKLRFANQEELMELTGLVPGSVPPFGKPFFNLELYIDDSIKKNDKIAFNAGSLTNSIIISMEDYLKIARSKSFNFSID